MAPRPGDRIELEIERLGARGDGIGRAGGTPVYVPFALPGDRLQARIEARRGDGLVARPLAFLARAPRADPACPHFGVCGGCRLQHLPAASYAEWQRRQVAEALARQGLGEVPVEPPMMSAPGSRRRVRLAFERRGGRLRLGFRVPAGREVVDIRVCPIAQPALEALLAPLRELVADLPLAARGGEALLTAADTGVDLLLIAAQAPGLEDRERLAAFADEQDLARIARQAGPADPPEPIVARRPVQVRFAGVPVDLPPGAFLQATRPAEDALRAAVDHAIGEAGSVADLFAGCGTFALPLAAEGRRILAIDGESAMLRALELAARRAGFGARLATEARDLERRPLAGAELKRFDAVVLDPPRTGARAQARELASAPVPRVAMVSCHPATFARDARALVEGGFALDRVRPIDAFLWSAQIELVGAFSRDRARPLDR